ncbi:MAG: hypothetical protein ACRERV_18615, partial [Methylococcales bacterium]
MLAGGVTGGLIFLGAVTSMEKRLVLSITFVSFDSEEICELITSLLEAIEFGAMKCNLINGLLPAIIFPRALQTKLAFSASALFMHVHPFGAVA